MTSESNRNVRYVSSPFRKQSVSIIAGSVLTPYAPLALTQPSTKKGTYLPNPRACDKCSYHYSDSERGKVKLEVIKNLTGLCVEFLGNKMLAEEELKL